MPRGVHSEACDNGRRVHVLNVRRISPVVTARDRAAETACAAIERTRRRKCMPDAEAVAGRGFRGRQGRFTLRLRGGFFRRAEGGKLQVGIVLNNRGRVTVRLRVMAFVMSATLNVMQDMRECGARCAHRRKQNHGPGKDPPDLSWKRKSHGIRPICAQLPRYRASESGSQDERLKGRSRNGGRCRD